jgi:guanylate kinase
MTSMVRRTTSPVLVVISAPSGAGKTTLCHNLVQTTPGLIRVITCTTRPPRPGERDGVDYHFLAPQAFRRRLAADEFIEHATVYGHHYGTLKASVLTELQSGRDVLLSVDVQGVAHMRAAAGRESAIRQALISVFIMPPSLEELRRRLTTRNQDPPRAVKRRLAIARHEMESWPGFDYVIVSQCAREDLARMREILAVEKLRAARTRQLVIP